MSANSSSARFLVDGERVSREQFLASGDDASMDVVYETVGGGVEDGEEPAAPAGDAGDAPVTLRVRDQTGDEMFFKVKKSTKMQKIFEAYAGRRGIAVNALRFMVDGERVKAEDTPKMLELEENDQVDVMLEFVGGGVDDEQPEQPAAEAPITLKVRDQTGEEMFFKVKKGTAMSKIFDAYAQRRGVSVQTLRFMLDDKRLTGTDTPKMLEMEEDDQIDVYLEQLGGADEEAEADVKVSPDDVPITIAVKGQDGADDLTHFKVKKGTKLSKVFAAYASRKGVDLNAVRFFFDGNPVQGDTTPKMLEMEENDKIDAVLAQTGGCCCC